jgi:hypothetical protein
MAKIIGVHPVAQIVVGPIFNTGGQPIGAGTTNLAGYQATITAKATCDYRIRANFSLENTGTGNAFALIVASSGSPTFINQSQSDKQPPSGVSPMYVDALVGLVAGQTYTFILQFQVAVSAVLVSADSMIIEQIL